MRFLVDECTGPGVAAWLRAQGHDVLSVYDDLRGASDASILQRAVAEERILISNDSDFGEMVFRERRPHRGVVFLRLDDERTPTKILVLGRLLASYSDRLPDAFVTATETQIRFAGRSTSP